MTDRLLFINCFMFLEFGYETIKRTLTTFEDIFRYSTMYIPVLLVFIHIVIENIFILLLKMKMELNKKAFIYFFWYIKILFFI